MTKKDDDCQARVPSGSLSGPTPGPWMKWKLGPDSDPEERWIVTTVDGEREICGIVYREQDADLLAAAPELLEACKMALGAFEHNNAIDWNDLERTLAKAEGKS